MAWTTSLALSGNNVLMTHDPRAEELLRRALPILESTLTRGLLDDVRTKVEQPAYGPLGMPTTVPAGSIGTVVLVNLEVEFAETDGMPYAFSSYDPDQVEVKWRYLK